MIPTNASEWGFRIGFLAIAMLTACTLEPLSGSGEGGSDAGASGAGQGSGGGSGGGGGIGSGGGGGSGGGIGGGGGGGIGGGGGSGSGGGGGGGGGSGGGSGSGNVLWSKSYGTGYVRQVAADPLGNLYVGGVIHDNPSCPVPAVGLYNSYSVMKLDPTGDILWCKTFTFDNDLDTGFLAARADDAGNVILAGRLNGTLTNVDDGSTLYSPAQANGFLVKLAPNGDFSWWRMMTSATGWYQSPASVAALSNGDLLVVGDFNGSFTVGGVTLQATPGTNGFIVRFDAAGNALWGQRFGETGQTQLGRIAVTGAGDWLVSGEFDGTVDFGNGPITCSTNHDAALVKLDSSGNALWTKHLVGSNLAGIWNVASVGEDAIALGRMYGAVTIDGVTVQGETNDGGFMMRFDANGNLKWAKPNSMKTQYHWTSNVDDAGNIFFVGGLWDTIDLGGGPLVSAGSSDIYLAKLDSAGNHSWSRSFGDAQPQYNYQAGSTLDAEGNLVVAGSILGTVDFGAGPMTAVSGIGLIYVAKFAP